MTDAQLLKIQTLNNIIVNFNVHGGGNTANVKTIELLLLNTLLDNRNLKQKLQNIDDIINE